MADSWEPETGRWVQAVPLPMMVRRHRWWPFGRAVPACYSCAEYFLDDDVWTRHDLWFDVLAGIEAIREELEALVEAGDVNTANARWLLAQLDITVRDGLACARGDLTARADVLGDPT